MKTILITMLLLFSQLSNADSEIKYDQQIVKDSLIKWTVDIRQGKTMFNNEKKHMRDLKLTT